LVSQHFHEVNVGSQNLLELGEVSPMEVLGAAFSQLLRIYTKKHRRGHEEGGKTAGTGSVTLTCRPVLNSKEPERNVLSSLITPILHTFGEQKIIFRFTALLNKLNLYKFHIYT
jgi:hypothetical protein